MFFKEFLEKSENITYITDIVLKGFIFYRITPNDF